ncbi:hypothetical protein [Agriterribacter humi]|uniref:hypothetical protein n=1 Tax=Agriterribacter humi TaxID=1104781 RepID=UPI0012647063|nr:hypothetical protein [Agriterribacter humi]
MWRLFFISCLLASCHSYKKIQVPALQNPITGSAFYMQCASCNWHQRDSLAVKVLLEGNMPSFLKWFVPVHATITSAEGKNINAVYYVSPDYLSIGNDADWARVPLTPMAAQKIADTLHCFLPTRKMVNEIYKAAAVKLAPVPMYAFRDSTVTMWQHHLIIEGQRKGKKGLIAGIKKDVVISEKIVKDNKPNRVAIYGWHLFNGNPIQPLYTGHVNWYVDYSHGIRLVYHKIKVNGKWMDYKTLLQDKTLRKLICDEADCNFYRY